VVLIDSSSWIHMLHPKGDPAARLRVETLLHAGTACWCPLVRLELWNGAGGPREKRVLRDMERSLPELPITADVWASAFKLAREARGAGLSVPATDILIAACARFHGVGLEHSDSDFDKLHEIAV
jgi:predicted nucleic acid-binding protein